MFHPLQKNSFAWSLLTGAGVDSECLKSLPDPRGMDWAPGWGNYVPGMCVCLKSHYLYAAGLTSFGGTASNTRLYPLMDPTGNIRFLTDSTGKLVARYSYDPYGNIRKKEGTIIQISF